MDLIPTDIFHLILLFTEIRPLQLFKLAYVSKRWNHVINNTQGLWKLIDPPHGLMRDQIIRLFQTGHGPGKNPVIWKIANLVYGNNFNECIVIQADIEYWKNCCTNTVWRINEYFKQTTVALLKSHPENVYVDITRYRCQKCNNWMELSLIEYYGTLCLNCHKHRIDIETSQKIIQNERIVEFHIFMVSRLNENLKTEKLKAGKFIYITEP